VDGSGTATAKAFVKVSRAAPSALKLEYRNAKSVAGRSNSTPKKPS
jgi:hypothetical protein